MKPSTPDLVVIGAGHAGCEAAAASVRMGVPGSPLISVLLALSCLVASTSVMAAEPSYAPPRIVVMPLIAQTRVMGVPYAEVLPDDKERARRRTILAALDQLLAETDRFAVVARIENLDAHAELNPREHLALLQAFMDIRPNSLLIKPAVAASLTADRYSIGTGLAPLGASSGADYALFSFAETWTLSDEAAYGNITAVMITGSPNQLPPQPSLILALVELKTGRVVWLNDDLNAPKLAQKKVALEHLDNLICQYPRANMIGQARTRTRCGREFTDAGVAVQE